MDVQHRRLAGLHHVLPERFSGVIAQMARALDKSPSHTRIYLLPEKTGGRWMGERAARDFEARLGLQEGWLDSFNAKSGEISKGPSSKFQTSMRTRQTIDQLRGVLAPLGVRLEEVVDLKALTKRLELALKTPESGIGRAREKP